MFIVNNTNIAEFILYKASKKSYEKSENQVAM